MNLESGVSPPRVHQKQFPRWIEYRVVLKEIFCQDSSLGLRVLEYLELRGGLLKFQSVSSNHLSESDANESQ
ncbi:hypothetical protein PGTUg99_015016 [Puccinia graminis f. sp. tritici]|uniref:Uncharacterized protein n=1 Tax=Puccinia graminis f. sp. tritici TaxID=56615 RepID=A0A5B0RN61_PUCGR|nr:hypothetical protein PGTUg99_015016 [Puccinia graminis f. sp. tritici]